MSATSPVLSSSQTIISAVAAKGRETVLLVESQDIERKLALSTRQHYRHHVLEASSPFETLMPVQQHAGEMHVTVSGLLMPEISDRDLAKRFLKQHLTMKALLVSGYDDEVSFPISLNRQYLLRGLRGVSIDKPD